MCFGTFPFNSFCIYSGQIEDFCGEIDLYQHSHGDLKGFLGLSCRSFSFGTFFICVSCQKVTWLQNYADGEERASPGRCMCHRPLPANEHVLVWIGEPGIPRCAELSDCGPHRWELPPEPRGDRDGLWVFLTWPFAQLKLSSLSPVSANGATLWHSVNRSLRHSQSKSEIGNFTFVIGGIEHQNLAFGARILLSHVKKKREDLFCE